jgi:hypothetical protein
MAELLEAEAIRADLERDFALAQRIDDILRGAA